MIGSILKIRLKQLYRAVSVIGIFRIFILMFIVVFAVGMLYFHTTMTPNVYFASGFYFLVIIFIHFKRKDKDFLIITSDKYKIIFFVEYLLFSLPLFVSLAINLHFELILGFVSVLFLIVNLNFKLKSRNLNSKLQRLIPDNAIEWKAGLRKTLFLVVLLWLVGLSFSFVDGIVPIVMFILGVIPISFYEFCEPSDMIIAFEKSSAKFLFQKIKFQVVIFSIIVLPLMIAFLIFNFHLWYVVLIEYFVLTTVHIYFILIKYSFYKPNTKATASQIFGTLGTVGVIIPVLLPLVWVLTIHFYFKSKQNLNYYLDDFN
ncbi:MAG: hypothetical protein JXL97_16415 [Bacteroidales bacterium]|nr:hypothetical protein [Bacteroidales bacterium]